DSDGDCHRLAEQGAKRGRVVHADWIRARTGDAEPDGQNHCGGVGGGELAAARHAQSGGGVSRRRDVPREQGVDLAGGPVITRARLITFRYSAFRRTVKTSRVFLETVQHRKKGGGLPKPPPWSGLMLVRPMRQAQAADNRRPGRAASGSQADISLAIGNRYVENMTVGRQYADFFGDVVPRKDERAFHEHVEETS